MAGPGGSTAVEISRTGSRTTSAPTLSLDQAVQALTGAALAQSQTAYANVSNLPRDPLDTGPFGPLYPLLIQAINPPRQDTGRPEPRVWEYPTGFNLPGGGDRLLPWAVLRAASTNVDIIRRCIEIRKDDISALTWSWTISEDALKAAAEADPTKPREDIEGELRAKYAPDIERLTSFWHRPWITNGVRFRQWVAAVMEDHITLDGVAVYPVTSVGGDVIAFRLVDATTIKLLINDLGERPQPPHPAFQQVVEGFPRGEYIADVVLREDGTEDTSDKFSASQLTYWRENFRTYTPYGFSQVEQALVSAALYLKRQGWMHAEYDEGSTPLTWLVPEGSQFVANQLSPMQRRENEQMINDDMEGQTGKRHRIKMSYPGFNPVQMESVDERYKPDYDLFLLKLVSSHLGVTLDRLGFTEAKGLGATGQHERQAQVQDDSGVNPDAAMLQDLILELSRNYLDAPLELTFTFTKNKVEDEAAKDAILAAQRTRGTITQNEDRRATGRQPLDIPEADMPSMVTATGIVYIEGGAEQQQKMQELAANPPAPGAPGPAGGGRPGSGGGGLGASGSKPKPSGPAGAPKNKAAADAEMVAYGRWLRKQGSRMPARPFRFAHATPDDFTAGAWDGRLQAFEGYEWRQDITKDWRSWNAEHPLHPRGPHGRFVKVGEILDELRRHHGQIGEMHENVLDEAVRRAHAGRHVKRGESALTDDLERRGLLEDVGKGRLGVSEAGRAHLVARTPSDYGQHGAPAKPAAPDPARAARERQARIDRARSIADLGAEVDELRGNEADLPVAQRRVAAMAAREPDNADLQAMASDLAGAGSLDQMHERARRHLERHGIADDNPAGTVEPFDRSRHRLIGGGDARNVTVVRPGHVFDDNGEQVRLSHAMVEEAAPLAAPSVEDARGQSATDRLRQAEVMYGSDRSTWPAKARRDAQRLERQAARERAAAPALRTSDDAVPTPDVPTLGGHGETVGSPGQAGDIPSSVKPVKTPRETPEAAALRVTDELANAQSADDVDRIVGELKGAALREVEANVGVKSTGTVAQRRQRLADAAILRIGPKARRQPAVQAMMAARRAERDAAALAQHEEAMSRLGDLHPQTEEEIRALAERAGLQVLNVTHGGRGWVSAAFAHKRHGNGERIANYDSEKGWTISSSTSLGRKPDDDQVAALLDEGAREQYTPRADAAAAERVRRVREARGRQSAAPEPVKSGTERQLEAQTEHYRQLVSRARQLDIRINSTEDDKPRAAAQRELEAVQAQMAALDRQIEAARKRIGRGRRSNKAAGGDEGKA